MARGNSNDQNVEALCRAAAHADGHDPDERVARDGAKDWPRWCEYRPKVIATLAADRARNAANVSVAAGIVAGEQPEAYRDAPLKIFGEHEESTIQQMRNCMSVGRVVGGVLCADGHLGYAQPVGGVIAYDGQISISGIGYDIACGTYAAKLDIRYDDVKDHAHTLLDDIRRAVSFGVGRVNDEPVDHELFDDAEAWKMSDMEFYRPKAKKQLGSAGTSNHFVDLMRDEDGFVWIGLHFGSRGLGHTTATRYLKMAGGKDGMHVAPTLLDVNKEIGQRYLAGMHLAGRYAYAGREWVMQRVRGILGGNILDSVHNHHNFGWLQEVDGRKLWVVRKGATPAFPGQRGFVGGSMGDDGVIIEGVESAEAKASLYSTVHGAGRLYGRKAAKQTFTRAQMDAKLLERGVLVSGGDVDESPMAYRRLADVTAAHSGSIRILHTLRPFVVIMAGGDEIDPWKD